MIERVKIVDIEIDGPSYPLEDLDGYGRIKALVRLHGIPVGYVDLPLSSPRLGTEDLKRIAIRQLGGAMLRHYLRDAVEKPLPPEGISLDELLDLPHPVSTRTLPPVTVAVCTRDGVENLRPCLDSLLRLDYPDLDLLVVDNAPSDDATERLVNGSYPRVRYVREPRPGLDWARNRAVEEARGTIIAYTDDDVVVDQGWVTALVEAFEDPQVMAVTGLVVPYELETEAQILFERYHGRGFGRGFERKYWRMDCESGGRVLDYLGAGQFGTGANMAFRRALFGRIGRFDPALDVGTVTNGGGDLEMFFRVLKEGHLLAYEPSAVVRHRHRRSYARLRAQLADNGVGLYSYLVRTALTYPDTRGDIIRFGTWWFWRWSIRRLILSYISPSRFPRDLILAELRGSLAGILRYPRARWHAARIASSAGGRVLGPPPASVPMRGRTARPDTSVCVRMIDLGRPLRGLPDVADYAGVRVFVALADRLLGSVDIANHHGPLSAARLREEIVGRFGLRLLGQDPRFGPSVLWEEAMAELRRRSSSDAARGAAGAGLPAEVSVSVVVATYDRPDDLRECLQRLTTQESPRRVEIVVVDNSPGSGLTSPVVAEFPGVVLVNEKRQGLAYARNRGFATSSGEIVVATDDDVLVPSGWLEKLVAPFTKPEVMVVTGNTLPAELETTAQRRFERYGGLGRGFAPREVDGEWFDSLRRQAVPTWGLGATANAAFRASVFSDSEVGLMDEALGPGTPTGVGEDTYLFYKVLKAGHTIVYEPSAYVWHRHRRERRALRNQLYNYSKGHVAYHLTTLLRDGDVRTIPHLTYRLPLWRVKSLARYAKRLMRRKERYPLSLTLLEMWGNLAGPWGLWRSSRRVERLGRSDPCASSDGRDTAAEGTRPPKPNHRGRPRENG